MSAGATSETELRAHRRIHPTIHMLSILIKYLRSNSNSVQDQFNIVKKKETSRIGAGKAPAPSGDFLLIKHQKVAVASVPPGT